MVEDKDAKFLSTPSARRATELLTYTSLRVEISIHALREEGDLAVRLVPLWATNFYPRPPRGGRRFIQGGVSLQKEFLSTPSARRATVETRRVLYQGKISIHALREEGDLRPW